MAYHKGLGVHLPPGGRLEVYEMPHENLLNMVRDQIGLQIDFERFQPSYEKKTFIVTNHTGSRIGETDICPAPIWTQLERHRQRLDHEDKSNIDEHFDFIYLCIIENATPMVGGVRRDADWFSLEDVKQMVAGDNGRRTFVDVYEGFKNIVEIIE